MKNKDTHIVIPFMIPNDSMDDFGAILNCAIRYCIGRQTYMPGLVTHWIMNHCGGILTGKTIWCAKRDIDEAEKNHQLGADCDVATWKEFRAWLDQQENFEV